MKLHKDTYWFFLFSNNYKYNFLIRNLIIIYELIILLITGLGAGLITGLLSASAVMSPDD